MPRSAILPPPTGQCPIHRPVVWLVHGFNVTDGGAGSVGKLAPYFEAAGFDVKRFRYGWKGLLGVRLSNHTFAQLLADVVNPGDIIVGHSNGGCIAKLAADLGAPAAQLVLINPALDADTRFAPQLGRIHIWHSPSDKPVAWARWLPWHAWGDMGAIGYRGPYDARVSSYNKENGFPVSSRAHSDVFSRDCVRYYGPLIVKKTIESIPT
jgi:pimeloyl-ACP methyl ester carboxylesterase